MTVLPQIDTDIDPDVTLSTYLSNIEYWLKNAQLLQSSLEGKEAGDELKHLNAFLKGRLFKRAIEIKNHSDDLKKLYLRCLEPYYSSKGIASFIQRYFDIEITGEGELRYRKKEKAERESNILLDLYKVKKTIETIDTLQKSITGDSPFRSRFQAEEQTEFLKTLKEIFKLFFIRFVKKEHQKELYEAFSDKETNPQSVIDRNLKGAAYLKPDIFGNTEHRDKFITVLFSTMLKTKVNDQLKELEFNYLNFEILKLEFLTDWLLNKLKGNSEKQAVLSNFKIGDQTVAEIIAANPAKEAEILSSIPIDSFNDLAEQVNLKVKEEDKLPIATMSKKHGVFAKLQGKVDQIKNAVSASSKKTGKKSKSSKNQPQIEAMVAKVNENVAIRDESTEAIENFMDSARKGDVNEKEITGFIAEMMGQSSPDAMSAIASLKQSDHTYAHCVDVSGIFTKVMTHMVTNKGKTTIFEDEKEIPFIGFMHDFGMSKVPKEILESDQKYEIDGPEMEMIRKHPEYGVELFQKMGQPDRMLNIIQYHHVKLSVDINSSYPKVSDYNQVNWETKLLAVVDVYQALVGKRAYKQSWSPPSAMRYLDNLAGTEYDIEVWDAFKEVMGMYPIGSLVKLSDDSLAFVMSVPEESPDQPEVVIAQTADGNKPEQHELIDLKETQDLTIKEDVDAQEVFGESALEMFSSINLS